MLEKLRKHIALHIKTTTEDKSYIPETGGYSDVNWKSFYVLYEIASSKDQIEMANALIQYGMDSYDLLASCFSNFHRTSL